MQADDARNDAASGADREILREDCAEPPHDGRAAVQNRRKPPLCWGVKVSAVNENASAGPGEHSQISPR
jgi:hypothetical protein